MKLKPAALSAVIALVLLPSTLYADELASLPIDAPSEADVTASRISNDISGYLKTLNFFTQTTGLTPELIDSPAARAEEGESLFSSLERLRLKNRTTFQISDDKKLVAKIDYDHQAYFGSFMGSGDFRISRRHVEKAQFLDLSQTLAEEEPAFYEHRLYRASLDYQSEFVQIEIGRQQIPWGVGQFFTPTDLFNPFNPTQLELDERNGVDAARVRFKKLGRFQGEFVFTPDGKQLHSQRYLTRLSTDFRGYEVGLIAGRVRRDHAFGFDFSGNIKESTVRGEFLYREAHLEKDFMRFTLNADYNFPHNLYLLLEYHFNGQGRRHPDDYQIDRVIRGEIQQMGKNFLASTLGYDLTELLRFENRTIFNCDDVSLFIRPELQYEATPNLLLLGAVQLYEGANSDEFGLPHNLYLLESKYSF